MSGFFHYPVIGIDVSCDFSFVVILCPDGSIFRKPFKICHDSSGFQLLLAEIKKVEEEFSMKTATFMEATGVYHLTLFHFLRNSGLDVFIINPLVTHSSKNRNIRKVKSDKTDALNIARTAKFENIKLSSPFDVSLFALKGLCREYYHLVDTRVKYKNKLSADLRLFFPGYHDVFSNIASITSLAVLERFPSPQAILDASKETLVSVISQYSRHSAHWHDSIYDKLVKAALNANAIGLLPHFFTARLQSTISLIMSINNQISLIEKAIKEMLGSGSLPPSFIKNLKLLRSIPGMGFISSVTLMSEIGFFESFSKPKELVAFLGIDPSVNMSGKFQGTRNKISKRGSSFARRALFAAALASVRVCSNGVPVNKVLLDYYKVNLAGKRKMVAIVAIMHKITNYIFAVLRDQKEYELRAPIIHEQLHLQTQLAA